MEILRLILLQEILFWWHNSYNHDFWNLFSAISLVFRSKMTWFQNFIFGKQFEYSIHFLSQLEGNAETISAGKSVYICLYFYNICYLFGCIRRCQKEIVYKCSQPFFHNFRPPSPFRQSASTLLHPLTLSWRYFLERDPLSRDTHTCLN